MKRGIFCILVLLILVVPLISSEDIITGDTVTGETITGEATTQQVNMQIYVQLTLPFLQIASPLNYTYRNDQISIDYISQGADFIWYNFDDGQNTTLLGGINISVSEGVHIFNLFANNSNGEKRSSSSFTVNSSKIIIIYDEFKGKGDTSNFDYLTYESLNSVGNVVLENPSYGKIEFRESIDFLEHLSGEENVVDLDGNADISEESISLDSSVISGLNKSSTLYLYNLNFNNPRILKDGVICPSSLCQIQSYSGGTLIFNVNSFSTYTVEENEDDQGEDTGSGSGGGSGGGFFEGGIEEEVEDEELIYFDLDVESINIKLNQGETKQEEIKIRNNGEVGSNFLVRQERLGEFILIENNSFFLNPGEERVIPLDFLARENSVPDLYLGKIIVESEGSSKEVFVSVEIASKKALFDVKTNIPLRYRNIRSGEELVVDVELFNLGEVGKVDVVVEYSLRDKDNNVILIEHEELAVETEISLKKIFVTPLNLEGGDYVFYVRVLYGDSVASSSSWFSIKGQTAIPWPSVILYVILLFILFTIIRLYQLYVKEQRKENVKKYEEEEKKEEKKKKLEKNKKAESKQRYVRIKAPAKSSHKKVVRKKVNRKLIPRGYLDLTKALKNQK